jgi:hypothetical protein
MLVEFRRSHSQVTRSPLTVASTQTLCVQAESPLIAKAMWTHCTMVTMNRNGEEMDETMVVVLTKKRHPRSEEEASESSPKRSKSINI